MFSADITVHQVLIYDITVPVFYLGLSFPSLSISLLPLSFSLLLPLPPSLPLSLPPSLPLSLPPSLPRSTVRERKALACLTTPGGMWWCCWWIRRGSQSTLVSSPTTPTPCWAGGLLCATRVQLRVSHRVWPV